MPENTQQEIADILIGNADSDTIANDLVDKFDESGKIGVDEVICENGACFTADTLISTQYGLKRIDEIKPGDKVYSFDEKTKKISLKSVLQVYEKESSELVHITVGDSVINATPTHPFYVPVKGWIAACELQAGDILYTVNGEYVVVEQIQHEILETPIKVYNFSVADNHTYFVATAYILVHNMCTPFDGSITGKDLIPNISKIEYGIDDLSKAALEYRKANGITNAARNVCVVQYTDIDGNVITKSFVSNSDNHSEELMITFLKDNEITGDNVIKLFSEREPCIETPTNVGHNCSQHISEYMPNAEVTYAVDYGLTVEDGRNARNELKELLEKLLN